MPFVLNNFLAILASHTTELKDNLNNSVVQQMLSSSQKLFTEQMMLQKEEGTQRESFSL